MNSALINRREFLKAVAGSSVLMSLPWSGGCTGGQTAAVSLVSNPDPSYAIRRAIEMIRGLDFLRPGDSVLIKPAINSRNPFPATTSPLVVSELIGLLKHKGAGDVFLGDRPPAGLDAMYCMKETGIYDAAVDGGAEIVEFLDDDMFQVKPERAAYWPSGFSVPRLFNRVDHIITLPRLSTHALAGFTMSLKILVGVLSSEDRYLMHISPDFLKGIAEIALATPKIRLAVLDAREGFSHGGPDEGTVVTPGMVIASKNMVAADAVGLALLKTVGTTSNLMDARVWDNPIIKRGGEVLSPSLSLETMDLRWENIELMDSIVENLQ